MNISSLQLFVAYQFLISIRHSYPHLLYSRFEFKTTKKKYKQNQRSYLCFPVLFVCSDCGCCFPPDYSFAFVVYCLRFLVSWCCYCFCCLSGMGLFCLFFVCLFVLFLLSFLFLVLWLVGFLGSVLFVCLLALFCFCFFNWFFIVCLFVVVLKGNQAVPFDVA